MLLYSIRSKATERHFVHTDGLGRARWNSTPVFWKTPDSIWKNLKRLCSEFYKEPYLIKRWDGKETFTYYRKNWKKFNKKRLKKYEVVQFSVKALGTTIIDAKDFIIPKKLKKMDVRIR